jgi:anti-anti-sigma factor
MQIDHRWRDQFVITALIGELDTPITDDTWNQLLEVSDFNPRGVILDLSRCAYIASSGISLIVRLAKLLRAQHIPLRMASASPAIRLVLETVNLLSLIPLDATIDQSATELTTAPAAKAA